MSQAYVYPTLYSALRAGRLEIWNSSRGREASRVPEFQEITVLGQVGDVGPITESVLGYCQIYQAREMHGSAGDPQFRGDEHSPELDKESRRENEYGPQLWVWRGMEIDGGCGSAQR